jgi:3-isopropylmalate/(R)-2-methylmalate dehydratase small subunit
MLDADACATMRAQLRANVGAAITVDLERQVAIDVEGRAHAFSIHPLRRRCLLEGLDDIALTAGFMEVIQPFEASYRQEFSWIDPGAAASNKP